ncbi:MAG TPA: hypothetical protein VE685_14060 [Thermoanaerobaculia bacterium]|nr:hypothetical protein [Thermoanaerobaculia bacterium]
MPRHDAISKEMIRAFLPDFLRLTAPDLAGRLDVSRARFLDKELFTDIAGGERREVDLLVQIPFLRERKDLLVHVEVEARARKGMAHRLWSYRNALQARHRCQVLTIVVYLRRGRPGVHVLPFDGDPLDPSLPDSRYVAFGLAGCSAAGYLARPEPLAWAFAALMDPAPRSRVEHKLACLQRVLEAGLDEARTFLLVNWSSLAKLAALVEEPPSSSS